MLGSYRFHWWIFLRTDLFGLGQLPRFVHIFFLHGADDVSQVLEIFLQFTLLHEQEGFIVLIDVVMERVIQREVNRISGKLSQGQVDFFIHLHEFLLENAPLFGEPAGQFQQGFDSHDIRLCVTLYVRCRYTTLHTDVELRKVLQ